MASKLLSSILLDASQKTAEAVTVGFTK